VKEHDRQNDADEIRCDRVRQERESVADRDERGPGVEMHFKKGVEREQSQPRLIQHTFVRMNPV
jgi:hypothetical protein